MNFNYSELLNQGVAIFVMCYFMYFNNTTMKEFKTTLDENTKAMILIKEALEDKKV